LSLSTAFFCSSAETAACHAREVSEADGESCFVLDPASVSREAHVRSARRIRRLSVKDRLVHGETRKFRNRPWKPLRPIIVASTVIKGPSWYSMTGTFVQP
jgi:hypothetical protein